MREENPTPTELDELFRVMDRDSPQGEMKHEAMTIWREMRAKGIIPTQDGYVALLKVISPPHVTGIDVSRLQLRLEMC